MIRFIVFFFALFLLVPSLSAKTIMPSFSMQNDDVLRGHFVQERNLVGFDKPLRSEGVFVVSPKRGVIWTSEKPFHSVTVITAAGLVQNAKAGNAVNLSSQKIPFMAQLYEMIGGVLTGKWERLENTFFLKFSNGEIKNSKQWKMNLLPRKADDSLMPFNEINVEGSEFVSKVVMKKREGDFDVLSFDNMKRSKNDLTQEEIANFDLVPQ